MCGLCGLLGEDQHWSSLPTNGQSSNAVLRRLARSRRIAIVNRMLDARRVRVSDWQGSQYLVNTATGKTQLRSEERRVGKECRSRWSPYH